ncbi:hypothetical protein PFISCL1PPCAC_3578 [Pristionchus fissidentatus]|uniref:SoHo domain-containing protein n=1 Tax=Pristionchus fissidentatus TaxID=1538716 RepID=A0AAV5UZ07_9BILA|nr:hypothetical protein PFISCL1PPCAC_3578 [Pristionchus fissidentatus]
MVAGNTVKQLPQNDNRAPPSRIVATSSIGGLLPPLHYSPKVVAPRAIPSLPDKSLFLKEKKSPIGTSPTQTKMANSSQMPGTRPEAPQPQTISDIDWFWFKPAQKYLEAMQSARKRIRSEPLPRFQFAEDRIKNSNLPFGTELVIRRI